MLQIAILTPQIFFINSLNSTRNVEFSISTSSDNGYYKLGKTYNNEKTFKDGKNITIKTPSIAGTTYNNESSFNYRHNKQQ